MQVAQQGEGAENVGTRRENLQEDIAKGLAGFWHEREGGCFIVWDLYLCSRKKKEEEGGGGNKETK